ncbi:hypothetical protein BDV09DRAFT_135997 [Aspergillus tetrazonus]
MISAVRLMVIPSDKDAFVHEIIVRPLMRCISTSAHPPVVHTIRALQQKRHDIQGVKRCTIQYGISRASYAYLIHAYHYCLYSLITLTVVKASLLAYVLFTSTSICIRVKQVPGFLGPFITGQYIRPHAVDCSMLLRVYYQRPSGSSKRGVFPLYNGDDQLYTHQSLVLSPGALYYLNAVTP